MEVTYKIKEIKLLCVLCKLQKVDFLIAIIQANDGYIVFFLTRKVGSVFIYVNFPVRSYAHMYK